LSGQLVPSKFKHPVAQKRSPVKPHAMIVRLDNNYRKNSHLYYDEVAPQNTKAVHQYLLDSIEGTSSAKDHDFQTTTHN